MSFLYRVCASISLFLIGLVAASSKSFATTPTEGQEAVLCLRYTVEVLKEAKDRKVELRIKVKQGSQERWVSVDLYESNHNTCVQLGRWTKESSYSIEKKLAFQGKANVTFHSEKFFGEKLANIYSAGDSSAMRLLALEHSPYVVIRDDQFDDNRTDRPLSMVYDVRTVSGTTILRYTLIFSDEDSKSSVSDTESQMARYGRRTDIEWVYMVELDTSGKVLKRRYQGGFLGGVDDDSSKDPALDIGHSYKKFMGNFLPGSSHPILYNAAKNNIFSDSPSKRQSQGENGFLRGHHLTPQIRVSSPSAREIAMLWQPWIFLVSDQELKRENKRGVSIEDYLLVSIRGTLKKGAFVGVMKFNDGSRILSGGGIGDVDRLGEDMWRQESFTGIPIGKERIEKLIAKSIGAEFSLTVSSAVSSPSTWLFGSSGMDFKMKDIQFYRIKIIDGTAVTENLNLDMIKQTCLIDGIEGLNSFCRF